MINQHTLRNLYQILIQFIIISIALALISQTLFAQDEQLPSEQAGFSEDNTITDDASTLPAPTISVDNPIETSAEEIELAWDTMDDAVGYNFELCADNECNRVMLYYDYYDLAEPKVSFKDLDAQQYYWRVSSVDDEGVEGLYTPPQPLLISDAVIAASNTPAGNTGNNLNNTKEVNTAGFIGPLPWYTWLVILAYLIFFSRIGLWYAGGKQ